MTYYTRYLHEPSIRQTALKYPPSRLCLLSTRTITCESPRREWQHWLDWCISGPSSLLASSHRQPPLWLCVLASTKIPLIMSSLQYSRALLTTLAALRSAARHQVSFSDEISHMLSCRVFLVLPTNLVNVSYVLVCLFFFLSWRTYGHTRSKRNVFG